MDAHTNSSKAERAGKRLGRAWRTLLRREARVLHWMVDQGAPPLTAKITLGLVKLAVFAWLLYVAFWLTLGAVFVLLTAAAAEQAGRDPDRGPTTWGPNEHVDHRKSLFYDPIAYNDDPDPRFEDHG